jgi:hypothetical protein
VVIVLTDHSATKGIVEQTNLRTSSTDRANKKLINASVYLSQYNLKIFYLIDKLNLVPNALSRLHATNDTIERPDGDVTLDNVWFTATDTATDSTLDDVWFA